MNKLYTDERSNILVIDDVPSNLHTLVSILKDEGYRIRIAKNGEAALRSVKARLPDLVLLDVSMPGMNGFEVCKQLKSESETHEIPIIFLTAKQDHSDFIHGFQVGAQDYVSKPFNSEEVLSRVRTHLKLYIQSRQLKSMNSLLEEKVKERTKQLEDANKKLASLERAKSNFLALISHELRTPLNGLTMSIEMLKKYSKEEEQEELLLYSSISTMRLERFIEIALLITSVDTKGIKESSELFLLKPGIEVITQRARKAAKEKGIVISIDCPDESRIFGSKILINKCVEFILENGVKYSGKNTNVRIKARDDEKNTIIDIIDQGPGFSEEAKKRLFEFFYCENVMNHSEGLGLGLATTKLIVDTHSGSIEIIPCESGGSCVRISFPKTFS